MMKPQDVSVGNNGGLASRWLRAIQAGAATVCLSHCALPEGSRFAQEPSSLPVASLESNTTPETITEMDLSGDVTLRKCIAVALQKNLSVKMATLEALASSAAITLEKAAFDPVLDAVGARFSDNNANSGNLVVRKRFITGAEVRAEGGTLFLDNTDRTQGETTTSNEYVVSIRQPLLSGAGLAINRAPIEKARLVAADASINTRIQVYEMLRGIESAYWTASYAADQETALLASLDRVRKVRGIIGKRAAEGAATQLDLLEADAAVARAEGSLYNATKARRDSLEQMWFIMGYPPQSPSGVQLAPLDDARMECHDVAPDARYAKASAEAPEVILLANGIRSGELDLKVAKNNLLPRVYAEMNWGSAAFVSSGTVIPGQGSDQEWSALLRLNIPWTFRAERAQLDMARAELARSKIAQENGMRQLRKDINETCRAITAAHQQLDAAERGSVANRKKFGEQQQRYEAGLASARDVMEAETELRQAETRELEERLRLVLASILLARQDGSILNRHGLLF